MLDAAKEKWWQIFNRHHFVKYSFI